jgi:hypothetical protein
VVGAMVSHGGALQISDPRVGVPALYADGLTLHMYLGGNPLNRLDPSGLVGIMNVLSTSMNMADMAADAMEQAAIGVSLLAGLRSMIFEYAMGQVVDFEWAADWDQEDDGFSAYFAEVDVGAGPGGPGRRVSMDMASKRKKAWSRARLHPRKGGPHAAGMRQQARQFFAKMKEKSPDIKFDFRTMRTDQRLHNADGQEISQLRPDFQIVGVDRSGKRRVYVLEYGNTQSGASLDRKGEKYKQLLGEDYGDYVHNKQSR